MLQNRLVKTSKYLSKHLRHRPDRLGIAPDPAGWVPVDELLDACARNDFPLTRAELGEVVEGNDKHRFELDGTGERIRARYGHSIPVEPGLEPEEPPTLLYHGTGEKSLPHVLGGGLSPMGRRYVHLSPDEPSARNVGARHGRPAVLEIEAAAMSRDGFLFYRAGEVWLVEEVPSRYLRCLSKKSESRAQ